VWVARDEGIYLARWHSRTVPGTRLGGEKDRCFSLLTVGRPGG
jgi:hypothetical protein